MKNLFFAAMMFTALLAGCGHNIALPLKVEGKSTAGGDALTKSPDYLPFSEVETIAADSAKIISRQGSAGANPVLIAGDSIRIDVVGEPELSQEFVILNNGFIHYPLLREVRVEGKTIAELTTELKERLSTYLIEPVVNVSVSRWRERKVYVFGDKISRAVSLTPNGANTVTLLLIEMGISAQEFDLSDVVLIRQWPAEKKEVIQLNLEKLLQDYSLDEDIELMPNDLIVLEESPKVYIEGGVMKPGGFPIARSRPLTLRSLIAMASGPQMNADLENVQIIREVARERREVIRVSASVERSAQAFYLKPGDIVVVPYHSSNFVTIYGEVKKPGTITLPSGETTRLSTIIAMAGGPTEYASSQVAIYRYASDGSSQIFSVNLNELLAGDAEQDIEIKPKDVVYLDSGLW